MTVPVSFSRPSPKKSSVSTTAIDDEELAIWSTAYWSSYFKGSTVTYAKPNEPILVISKESEEKFWNVLIGEKTGWIIVRDWHDIKPLEI